MLRTFIWKEAKELARDKKTVLASIILPFVMFPLIGLLLLSTSVSPIVIAIVVQDPRAYNYANMIAHVVNSSGGIAVIGNSSEAQITIVIPKGFSQNVTNLSRPVTIIIDSFLAPTPKAQNILSNVIFNLTLAISYLRINNLAKKANITVKPELIWDPVEVVNRYITLQHSVASSATANVAQFTRLLVFIIFPGSSPIVFYLTESIVGERDRKTLEALLSTPIRLEELIYSKLAVSFALGLLSGLGDIMGVGLLVFVTGIATGVSAVQMVVYMAYIIATVVGILLMSAFLTLLFLYALGGSTKVFQVVNVVVVLLSLLASFYGLFFSPGFLSFPASLALLIPYIQFAAVLLIFAFGNAELSLTIYLVSLVILLLGIKVIGRAYSSERLLLR